MILKFTKIEIENWFIFGKNLWQEASFSPRNQSFIWRLIRSIKEAIHLPVVTMQITKNTDSSRLFKCGSNIILKKIDFRMNGGVWICPSSIEINTSERASRVTDHDSVRVYHGDYLNNCVMKKLVVLLIVLSQFIDYFIHYKASMCLSCVQS